MTASASSIFGVAAFKVESRFLVALFMQIMQELRIGCFRKLRAERINALKNRKQVWLGCSWAHRLHRTIQFLESLQNAPLSFVHPIDVTPAGNLVNATFP